MNILEAGGLEKYSEYLGRIQGMSSIYVTSLVYFELGIRDVWQVKSCLVILTCCQLSENNNQIRFSCPFTNKYTSWLLSEDVRNSTIEKVLNTTHIMYYVCVPVPISNFL